MRTKIFLLLLLILPSIVLTGQQKFPVPNGKYLVIDHAHLMQRSDIKQLDQKLKDYANATNIQLLVFTLTSLKGEDAGELATRMGHELGVGDAKEDKGVIVLIAKEERKVRIQTGYGAEIFLPDAMSKRIIDNILTPAFKSGEFYAGLDRATDAIMELGSEGYKPKKHRKRKKNFNIINEKGKKKGGIPGIFIVIGVIIIFFIISKMNNRGGGNGGDGGYNRGGRYGHPGPRRRGGGWIFFPGGGFGGGGGGGGGGSFGGGSDGGGFGGFGGGDFGGGGAGGDW